MTIGEAYTCAACGETYTKSWPDSDAKKESIEIFGELPEDELAIICDDCFNKMGFG